MFSNVIVFTVLVPRYQRVFSNITDNAGTEKLENRIATRSMRISVAGLIWTPVFVTKKTGSSRAV